MRGLIWIREAPWSKKKKYDATVWHKYQSQLVTYKSGEEPSEASGVFVFFFAEDGTLSGTGLAVDLLKGESKGAAGRPLWTCCSKSSASPRAPMPLHCRGFRTRANMNDQGRAPLPSCQSLPSQ